MSQDAVDPPSLLARKVQTALDNRDQGGCSKYLILESRNESCHRVTTRVLRNFRAFSLNSNKTMLNVLALRPKRVSRAW